MAHRVAERRFAPSRVSAAATATADPTSREQVFLRLQRTAGNGAVCQLLATKPPKPKKPKQPKSEFNDIADFLNGFQDWPRPPRPKEPVPSTPRSSAGT